VVFEYNNNGLLAKRTNARGVETVYGYDENHQLSSLTHSDDTPNVTFTYDDHRRLATAADALGTHIYSYYNNDRLLSVDGPWENDTLTYTYDGLGRLDTITPEGGRGRTHTYDRQGRFETLTVGGANTYTYGYLGTDPRVRSLTRPNGSRTAFDYDGLNRLKQIAHNNAAEQLLGQFDFDYNGQDLIERETVTGIEAVSGLTNGETLYTPNDLNQLTATTNPARTYAYDDDGNLTTGYTPSGLAYTATYDALNRLSSMEYTDGGTLKRYEFSYRHDGFLGSVRRFENAALLEELRILRNGALAVQERDGANTILREYVWGQDKGGGIGGLLTLRQGGEDYDYLYDGKGNVSRIIDDTQVVVATYRYDVFGNLKVASSSLDQPFRFSTKRHFADLGLNYYGYRYYAPSIGRWMSLDPLGEAGGLNLYGFVQNDPVNWIDPYGLTITTLPFPGIPVPPPALIGIGIGFWIWDQVIDPYLEARSKRKKTDPPWVDDYKQHNPGKDPNGRCKPCKENSPVWTNPNQDDCRGHQIVYNQDPVTCECYPDRTHN
jgi:RHS repeat-associated protein